MKARRKKEEQLNANKISLYFQRDEGKVRRCINNALFVQSHDTRHRTFQALAYVTPRAQ
jgi:hypothetical protein